MKKIKATPLMINMIMFLILISFVIACPVNMDSTMKEYFLFLLGNSFVITVLLSFVLISYDIYLFEPFTIVSVLYYGMFCCQPLIDIISGDTTILGFEVFNGCFRATIIFSVSFVLFLFGYFYNRHGIVKNNNSYKNNIVCNESQIIFAAVVIWSFGFLIGIYNFISQGKSVLYVFSVGLKGSYDSVEHSGLGAFGNMQHLMVAPLMYMFIHMRKKTLPIFLYLITTLMYFTGGSRWILVVLFGMPVVYHYTLKNKTPKMSVIILGLTGVLILFGFIEVVRYGIRSGAGFDGSSFEVDKVNDVIKGNLDIYKGFYGMVEAVPNELEYQLGAQTLLAPIWNIVPRAIWPSKPKTPTSANQYRWLGTRGSESGIAYPKISEFYFDFGVIGAWIGMLITGIILGKIIKWFNSYDRTENTLVGYSIFYPLLVQLIGRADAPNNFYKIVFLLLPVLFMSLIMKRRNTSL